MKTQSITVAGRSFKIKSDADEDHITKLADEISTRFRSFKLRSTGPRAEQDILAMAMVSIALLDELATSKKDYETLLKKTEEFSKKMISRIDELLTANEP